MVSILRMQPIQQDLLYLCEQVLIVNAEVCDGVANYGNALHWHSIALRDRLLYNNA